MLKVGVLCSGTLGLLALKTIIDNGFYVPFVFTDNSSTDIGDLCITNKIKCFIGNPREGRAVKFLKNLKVDVIASVNYLYLIDKDIIEFPDLISFNIHGSLLPKYRGRTPHVWSIINNEKETGITAHLIDSGCDTGHILEQKTISIDKNDTGNDLLKKYYVEYPPMILSVLKSVQEKSLNIIPQNENLATYYGKRTPSDGLINWDWQKERIYNWVRAQAFPYPGAYTFYKKEKIIIDKICFSNCGYTFDQENGTILSTENNIIVKTPNGAVEILEMRDNNIKFSQGSKLK